MKKILTPFIFLLITTGMGACKKNKEAVEKKAVVTTIAGGDLGFEDGPVATAKFRRPYDIAVNAEGSVYVIDFSNKRVRKITADGQVTTVAGSGISGNTNGNGTTAEFKIPTMIALDVTGNAYVFQYTQVRKIKPNADVSLYAGTDEYGFADGPSSTAMFRQGFGMLVDPDGNIIVADSYNNRIRKISTAGQVTTIAGSGIPGFSDGNGSAAQFNNPEGIAMDKKGNLFVADTENFRIRKITPACVVSTFAGSGIQGHEDGNAAVAKFYGLQDMVTDKQGNIYVVDNNSIRKITPAGEVSTLAGSAGYGFADGKAAEAKFDSPIGLAIDAAGNIYVADYNNNCIRKISFE